MTAQKANSKIEDLIEIKKRYPEYEMILHSDQGATYASKAFHDPLTIKRKNCE